LNLDYDLSLVIILNLYCLLQNGINKSADILEGVFVSLFELRYFVSSVADLHLSLLLYMLERSNISVLILSHNISLVEVHCLYTCIDLCFRVL
jgi:hypothetical protein